MLRNGRPIRQTIGKHLIKKMLVTKMWSAFWTDFVDNDGCLFCWRWTRLGVCVADCPHDSSSGMMAFPFSPPSRCPDFPAFFCAAAFCWIANICIFSLKLNFSGP